MIANHVGLRLALASMLMKSLRGGRRRDFNFSTEVEDLIGVVASRLFYKPFLLSPSLETSISVAQLEVEMTDVAKSPSSRANRVDIAA